MIRLICIDIDGTLLNSQKEIPRENIEAIRYAIKKGAKFALATGRSRQGVEYLFQSLQCDENAICLNGGLLMYQGKNIYQRPMNEEVVHKIIDLIERYEAQLFLTGVRGNITVGFLSDKLKQEIQQGSLMDNYCFYANYEELRRNIQWTNILKIAARDFDEERLEMLSQELQKIKEILVLKSDTSLLEIVPADSGKDKGIEIFARQMRIAPEEILCIGDSENDIAMLRHAGIGVAMGNAEEKVKNAADYVTTDNDHAGVAKAIYAYMS